MSAELLRVRIMSDDAAAAHRHPLAVVVLEVVRRQLGCVGLAVAQTRLPPVLWYLRIPSAAREASAPPVPVGWKPAFWGKLHAPTTKTFGASHICRYELTTDVCGSAPMIAPPVLCVDW